MSKMRDDGFTYLVQPRRNSRSCSVCDGPMRAGSRYGICSRTRECRLACGRLRGRDSYLNNHGRNILTAAKRRSRLAGVEFSLTLSDLPPIPSRCPILGLELRIGEHKGPKPEAPSLDRKVPALGYVPDNIWWISHQANTMKSSADAETLKKFAQWIIAETGEQGTAEWLT